MGNIVVDEKDLIPVNDRVNQLHTDMVMVKTEIPYMRKSLERIEKVLTAQAVQTEKISQLEKENVARKTDINNLAVKVENNQVSIWKLTLMISGSAGFGAVVAKMIPHIPT